MAPHSPWCPPSPLPRQQEDLRQWAGSAGRAPLAGLQGQEGSCSQELWSGPSTEWAEHTDLSRSTEEESTSWSLQSEPRPEDSELSSMAREEIGLGSLPSEAWTEDLSQSREEESTSWSLSCVTWDPVKEMSCSSEKPTASGFLLSESWTESWGSKVCRASEDVLTSWQGGAVPGEGRAVTGAPTRAALSCSCPRGAAVPLGEGTQGSAQDIPQPQTPHPRAPAIGAIPPWLHTAHDGTPMEAKQDPEQVGIVARVTLTRHGHLHEGPGQDNQGTLSCSADSTKLCGSVDLLEGWEDHD